MSVSCSLRPGRLPVVADVEYDDTVYCFNQRYIVSLGRCKGLIDGSGNVILSPEWDSVEFLDDDVALLEKDGNFYLSTKDGRIFAENRSHEALESGYGEMLAETMEEDLRAWDSVLDELDALCDACLGCPSKKPDKAVLDRYAQLKERLSSVSGKMTRNQEERLAGCLRRFNDEYRR